MTTTTMMKLRRCQQELESVIHETPFRYSEALSSLTGRDIFLKYENLQRTGSFKIRGAYVFISALSERERARGVITASAGNHAQGVAFSARHFQVPCTIVMPESTPLVKVEATKWYGANVILFGSDYDEALSRAHKLEKECGYVFVPAFDNEFVIYGQGTIGLELDTSLFDAVVVPIGGGGLASGISLALSEVDPRVRVFGVEPTGAATMHHAFSVGRNEPITSLKTIADGLATKHVGDRTFEICKEYLEDIVLVTDDEIAEAILLILEKCNMLAEGAGAAGLAAVCAHKIPEDVGRVALIVSGGNLDPSRLGRIIERGETALGRKRKMSVVIDNKPGAGSVLMSIFARNRVNVTEFIYRDREQDVPYHQARVQIEFESPRDAGVMGLVKAAITQEGFTIE